MNDLLTIHCGDALSVLKMLPEGSVQCCVTSPPYWGLRDYGTAKWDGGSEECDHATRDATRDATSTLAGTSNKEGFALNHYKHICGKCGAKRIDNQLGLEKTPEEYVSKLVAVFKEVRRVLKNDGTLWLNLGDTYASDTKGSGGPDSSSTLVGTKAEQNGQRMAARKVEHGLKSKDLCGIPWRVAFALQEDGWWLRSDIIWSKPNPMPESVTDRPTKAHEYIFLLTKNGKYFYDAESIAEPVSYSSIDRLQQDIKSQIGSQRANGGSKTNGTMKAVIKRPNPNRNDLGESNIGGNERLERNKRTVWTVTTQGYSDAHFATFPPDLIKPCILAGSKAGGTILDPFAGSGTTGMVAMELGRKAILIELNPKYVDLIKQRCDVTPGLALT